MLQFYLLKTKHYLYFLANSSLYQLFEHVLKGHRVLLKSICSTEKLPLPFNKKRKRI